MRILYFDLDCIRDDHLGCYGYHRDTSPVIDGIAREGVRFTRCYTSNAPCAPSRAALFSGRFGINNGIATNTDAPLRYPGGMAPRDARRLAPSWMRHLMAHGFHTVSFSNFADRHKAWWFHEGWSEFHMINLRCGFETADEVNAKALPWFEAFGARDNYFAHIHYWDIHFPYRLPDMPRHMERFRNDPLPAWPDEETIRRQYASIHGSRTAYDLWGGNFGHLRQCPWMPEKVSNLQEFRQLIDGYDASIHYVDQHMGQILDVLRRQGALDDTAIIISGDHGDCFGECGGHYMDHTIGSEPELRRPLIIRWPEVTRPAVRDEMIYLLDLAPTVCELAGLPASPPLWDGLSFAPALRDQAFSGREFVVLESGMGALQRVVRTRDHAFVRTLHPGLYPIDEPDALYDMRTDPAMTRNCAADHPERVQQHKALLADWLAEQFPRHAPHPDPLEEAAGHGEKGFVLRARQYAEKLRDDGRPEHAEALLRRMERCHPGVNWKTEF